MTDLKRSKSSNSGLKTVIAEADQMTLKLGNNIRKFRQIVLKESMEDFAGRIGASKATLWRMERGDASVATKFLARALCVMQTSNAVLHASMSEALLLSSMMNEAEKTADVVWAE